MNKILLTILIVFSIVSNSFSQEWNEIFSNDKIKIETQEVICNPNNNQYPFSYLLMKYTNISNEEIKFKFEYELWYNDTKFKQSANQDISPIMDLHLFQGEKIIGKCDDKSNMLKVFNGTTHPEIVNKMTKFNIVELKTK